MSSSHGVKGVMMGKGNFAVHRRKKALLGWESGEGLQSTAPKLFAGGKFKKS